MESRIFSNLHVIVEPEELNDISFGHRGMLSLRMDVGDESAVKTVFEYVFSPRNDRPFSINITMAGAYGGAVQPSWFNKFFLMLCHPLYFRMDEKLVIGVSPEDKQQYSWQILVKQLESELKRQGLVFTYVNFGIEAGEGNNKPPFFFDDPESTEKEFFPWYFEKLKSTNSIIQIICRYNKSRSPQQILDFIDRSEETIMKQEPLLYRLIEKEIFYREQLDSLKLKIDVLQSELSSKNEYLAYLTAGRSGDNVYSNMGLSESMKISKFYQQEYEILPLWYKRFGHIIKVITGKRSLRSLYDKNAPKYKK
jgi:hypothetical protein